MTGNALRTSLIAGALVLLGGGLQAQAPVPPYDTATETTVTAPVEQVFTRQAADGLDLVLVMIIGGQETEVYIGPVMFVANNNLFFQCRDEVTIAGSKVKFESKPWIVAREVTKAGVTLKMRDAKGAPLWTSTTSAPSGK